MSIGWEELVQSYGYPVLVAGTFLEGETIAVLAGFLAFRGLLKFPLAVGFAFIGTVLGDQLYFYLGRKHGRAWLERRSNWQARILRLERLIRRRETAVILAFRFIYGMRTITPVALGASGTHWLKFLVLNVISAIVWSFAVVSLGYFFGAAAKSLLGHIEAFELIVISSIIAVGAGIWVWHLYRNANVIRK